MSTTDQEGNSVKIIDSEYTIDIAESYAQNIGRFEVYSCSEEYEPAPPLNTDDKTLGLVANHAEDIYEALEAVPGEEIHTQDVAKRREVDIGKRWTDTILREMAENNLISLEQDGTLGDKDDSLYTLEEIHDSHVEKFVEAYRRCLD